MDLSAAPVYAAKCRHDRVLREGSATLQPISISGYHIREAGATALQELSFTLRDGIEYAQCAVAHGLHVDAFASRLRFFFGARNDFFEEIAKYRAARRIWYKLMKDRFGAKIRARACFVFTLKPQECR